MLFSIFPVFAPLRSNYVLIYAMTFYLILILGIIISLKSVQVGFYRTRQLGFGYTFSTLAFILLFYGSNKISDFDKFPYFSLIDFGITSDKCINELSSFSKIYGCIRKYREYGDGDYYLLDLDHIISESVDRHCTFPLTLVQANPLEIGVDKDDANQMRLYIICRNRAVLIRYVPHYLAPFGSGRL